MEALVDLDYIMLYCLLAISVLLLGIVLMSSNQTSTNATQNGKDGGKKV